MQSDIHINLKNSIKNQKIENNSTCISITKNIAGGMNDRQTFIRWDLSIFL